MLCWPRGVIRQEIQERMKREDSSPLFLGHLGLGQDSKPVSVMVDGRQSRAFGLGCDTSSVSRYTNYQASGRNLPLFSFMALTFFLSSSNLFSSSACSAFFLSRNWKR